MNQVKNYFTIQADGYDVQQVDSYIQRVAEEYENLRCQYEKLLGQYSSLASQRRAQCEATSQMIADAMSKQIVAEAKTEADRIVQGAVASLNQINNEKVRVAGELYDMAKWLAAKTSA